MTHVGLYKESARLIADERRVRVGNVHLTKERGSNLVSVAVYPRGGPGVPLEELREALALLESEVER